MSETFAALPRPLVERFVGSLAAFVKAAEDAAKEAAHKPEFANTSALEVWRMKALPLLQLEMATAEQAAVLFQSGDSRAILVAAEDKRGLAKDMDGFPLNFAGPDHAQILGELRTSVVRAAYRLCAAAEIA